MEKEHTFKPGDWVSGKTLVEIVRTLTGDRKEVQP